MATTRRPAAGVELIGPALGVLVALYLLVVPLGPDFMKQVEGTLGHSTGSPSLGMSITYLLPAALAAPLGTVFGRRFPNAVAAASLGVLLVGAALHSLTPDYSLLVVGRIASGLGAGALVASTVVLALRAGYLRGRTIAVAAGAGALASVLGFIVGLAVARSYGWRLAFVLSLPPMVIALLVSVIGGFIMVTHNRPAPR